MIRIPFLAALGWAFCLTFSLTFSFDAWAQTGALARIKSEQTIVLGYNVGAPPFSSTGADGQPQGYSVDLCRAVAEGIGKQLGIAVKTRWVPLTVQERLEAVRTRKVDLECGTTTWTLSRQATVDFSLITFIDGGSVITLAESPATRINDFGGRRIAVLPNTTTEKSLREMLARRSVQAQLQHVASREEGLKLVDEGRVDGFAGDRTTLLGLAAASPKRDRFKLLNEDFSLEAFALPLARDDHDFRLAVNRVLAGLYRSGNVLPIYERWLGPLGSPGLLLSATYFIQGVAE